MALIRLPIINQFRDEVSKLSGQALYKCNQCGKCSASCPFGSFMDYLPNQLMELLSLGLKDDVLKSSTIWVCASCMSCAARCPKDIDIAAVNDALHLIAIKEGYENLKEPQIPLFYKIFIAMVRSRGRINELGLMRKYKIATKRQLFQDLILGLRLFFKFKLKPITPKVKQKAEIYKIFREEK